MSRICAVIILALVVALTVAPSLSFAGEGGDFVNNAGHKLGRGVANVATGWVELPKTIHAEASAHDAFTGIVYGLMKGAGKTVIRTGAGAYEVATFLFPVPKDYQSVIDPEYVF